MDRSIDWLIARLNDLLIDWSIDWLIDWFFGLRILLLWTRPHSAHAFAEFRFQSTLASMASVREPLHCAGIQRDGQQRVHHVSNLRSPSGFGHILHEGTAMCFTQCLDDSFRLIIYHFYIFSSFLQTIIYYLAQHPKLPQWLVCAEKELTAVHNPDYYDLDTLFMPNIDVDFDFRYHGVSRHSFYQAMRPWMDYCMRKNQSAVWEQWIIFLINFFSKSFIIHHLFFYYHSNDRFCVFTTFWRVEYWNEVCLFDYYSLFHFLLIFHFSKMKFSQRIFFLNHVHYLILYYSLSFFKIFFQTWNFRNETFFWIMFTIWFHFECLFFFHFQTWNFRKESFFWIMFTIWFCITLWAFLKNFFKHEIFAVEYFDGIIFTIWFHSECLFFFHFSNMKFLQRNIFIEPCSLFDFVLMSELFQKKIWNMKFLQWNIFIESCSLFNFILSVYFFSFFKHEIFAKNHFFESCSLFDFVLLFEHFLKEIWNMKFLKWNMLNPFIIIWFLGTWNFTMKCSNVRSWLWIRRKRRTLSHWHSPWASADAVFWAQLHSSPCTREYESTQ